MSPPLHAHEWRSLAECAELLLADRVAGYPEAVAANKLTPEAAARGIAAMTAVVAVWREAAAFRLPEHDFAFDRHAMIETLRIALRRLHATAAADPHNDFLANRRDCTAAMLWWHERFSDGPFHMVRGTLIARERAARDAERIAA
ncbi:hypothetical protein SAMN05444678_102230 [Sphingomonas sp. YR710]|uniref:hypothetical protein n=1 Tax=Sphingomonas sp. YR710 TaxID=1882773 RepID=UPI00088DA4DF|nr:hypothetical protein [Sphingomonas sp. YR710]SDC29766.1 hypothetical protein SAMN05444678_102230 [Sphingomonas sp. YR710]